MKFVKLLDIEKILLDREPVYYDVLNDRYDTWEKIKELQVIEINNDDKDKVEYD